MKQLDPFAQAKWVCAPKEWASPVIVRRFEAAPAQKATLYITGLGYFAAKINGVPVSDDWFIPVASDYHKRPTEQFHYPTRDQTRHRVYYYTYDITSLLKPGENVLCVQLGNGWYRQTERTAEGPTFFGDTLKALYHIEIESAAGKLTIDSDGSEVCTESEIRYSNLFVGEVVDPCAVSSEERPVTTADDMDTLLCPQIGTPDKVMATIMPRPVAKTGAKTVFDVGENVSGVVRVYTTAPAGQTITLRFAENVTADHALQFDSTGCHYKTASGRHQIMTDVFVADGTGRWFQPQFVWHAFRYFEIEGDFEKAEVLVIHSNTPVTAAFESAGEGLDYLYRAFIRTQLNNMHGSFPSDCPHRERLGYTGDGQLCAPAAMMTLDSQAFYRKWIQDILDCQDPASGHVQHTAPFMGGGGGPGGWGCAIVFVPYAYYRQFGDRQLLAECYIPMLKWLAYLHARCENGLITKEEDGGWCLGDWCTLQPVALPPAFVNTVYYIKVLALVEHIANILGRRDRPDFHTPAQEAIAAVNAHFYNGETYCGGVQGADAFAVWAGLRSDRPFIERLAERYRAEGRFDTGILGTDILLEVLFENGCEDTAFTLLQSEKPGSFLYMKRHHATTLWETWQGGGSHDHPMFGGCVRQLFHSILGITQKAGTGGYEDLIIAPKTPRQLAFAKGSMQTPQGPVAVCWQRQANGVRFHISAPPAVHAVLQYARQTVEFSGELSIVI